MTPSLNAKRFTRTGCRVCRKGDKGKVIGARSKPFQYRQPSVITGLRVLVPCCSRTFGKLSRRVWGLAL